MWERFTEGARKVVLYSQQEALRLGQPFVSTEHLLLGLIREDDNLASRILGVIGIDLGRIRSEIERQITRSDAQAGQELLLTPRAKQVIDFAYVEARELGDNYLGTEHLLLGMIRRYPWWGVEGEGTAARVLAMLGVTAEAVRKSLLEIKQRNAAKSEELLTLDEAVKFLGTSKPTLYRLLGQDEIKGLKVGRQWRFRRVDLVAYMERSPVAVAAAPKEDLDRELAFFAEQLKLKDADVPGDAEAKTFRLACQIIQLAILTKASDIHLEPTAQDFLLRCRVDGALQETRRLPISVRESLTAQFKKMADIDLNEKSLLQDGRIPVNHDGIDFDLRVACIPSVYGEAVTLRILNRGTALLGLDKLGIAAEDLLQIRDMMHRPNGIFVTTGPASAGKTTFMYSCIQEVANLETKTMTIEDPVEYILENTTQVQVNTKAFLTFASGLRAFMRQDPDVIMVGKTPDLETVQLVVEASQTGHLLLISLYTTDAPKALLRLLDMGVEPHLVSAAVVGAIALRLCRKICTDCKVPVDLTNELTLSYVTQLAAEGGYRVPAEAVFYRGLGCEQCRGRGYFGRIGLYEVLTMTDPLTEALLRRASPEEMTALAVAGGMRTLLADGIRKAVEGQTTIEEVLRVVSISV